MVYVIILQMFALNTVVPEKGNKLVPTLVAAIVFFSYTTNLNDITNHIAYFRHPSMSQI